MVVSQLGLVVPVPGVLKRRDLALSLHALFVPEEDVIVAVRIEGRVKGTPDRLFPTRCAPSLFLSYRHKRGCFALNKSYNGFDIWPANHSSACLTLALLGSINFAIPISFLASSKLGAVKTSHNIKFISLGLSFCRLFNCM